MVARRAVRPAGQMAALPVRCVRTQSTIISDDQRPADERDAPDVAADVGVLLGCPHGEAATRRGPRRRRADGRAASVVRLRASSAARSSATICASSSAARASSSGVRLAGRGVTGGDRRRRGRSARRRAGSAVAGRVGCCLERVWPWCGTVLQRCRMGGSLTAQDPGPPSGEDSIHAGAIGRRRPQGRLLDSATPSGGPGDRPQRARDARPSVPSSSALVVALFFVVLVLIVLARRSRGSRRGSSA